MATKRTTDKPSKPALVKVVDTSDPPDIHFNPCLNGRHPKLAPLGDWLASLTPDCPCCAAVRGLALALGTGIAGFLLGMLVMAPT